MERLKRFECFHVKAFVKEIEHWCMLVFSSHDSQPNNPAMLKLEIYCVCPVMPWEHGKTIITYHTMYVCEYKKQNAASFVPDHIKDANPFFLVGFDNKTSFPICKKNWQFCTLYSGYYFLKSMFIN